MEMQNELDQVQEILKKEAGEEQAERIMDSLRKTFNDADYETLAKLQDYYDKGYITDNEYLIRITSILHERMIHRHESA